MSGIFTIKEILGIDNVVIAVEDNKPAAFEVLNRIAENSNDIGDHVKLMALKSLYPQGAEKMMVQSATGRRVPPGKLPADVGCIVMNVGSAAFVSRYLKSGKPFVSRSITVDGSAISEPKNIRLPIGTRITDVIDYCGGYKTDVYKLLMGGPMMGIAWRMTVYRSLSKTMRSSPLQRTPIISKKNAPAFGAGGACKSAQ